jgi:hypothetical protein
MYSALQLLKDQVHNARETFEGTVSDVTDDQLHADLGGKAPPLGALYAHLIFSEDVIMQSMIQGKTPLYQSSWKDKTGASEPMPPMDDKWATAHEAWTKSVKIDLPQLREYSKAVYATTDEYLNSLKDEDLEKEVDLGPWGKKTVAYLLYAFIIGHTNNLTGEISLAKGVQGAKGYPF